MPGNRAPPQSYNFPRCPLQTLSVRDSFARYLTLHTKPCARHRTGVRFQHTRALSLRKSDPELCHGKAIASSGETFPAARPPAAHVFTAQQHHSYEFMLPLETAGARSAALRQHICCAAGQQNGDMQCEMTLCGHDRILLYTKSCRLAFARQNRRSDLPDFGHNDHRTPAARRSNNTQQYCTSRVLACIVDCNHR